MSTTSKGDSGSGPASSRTGLTIQQKLHGKFHAAQILTEFARYFSNWREVWSAYRSKAALPQLHLRNGFVLDHVQDNDETLFVFREIFEEHCYTSDGFYAPKSTDVVLDIGANIGAFAIYLQTRARGIKVHCFEPASSTRERLQRNLTINNLGSSVFVYPYAVIDKNGIAYLGQHVHSVERALVANENGGGQAERVESITLARAVELSGATTIDLVKIDIEGAETELILSTEADLWKRVERVVLEYHESIRPGCREVLTKALAERGFDKIQCVPSRYDGTGMLRASR